MKKILILTAVLLAIINFNYVSADDTTKQEDIKYEIINTPQEEFKIEIVDKIGDVAVIKIGDDYALYNTAKTILILPQVESKITIEQVNNYVKVKFNNKYGLVDLKGNVILAPVFQRISTNDKILYGKVEGKYKVYDEKGKLVPEQELYSVEKTKTDILADDIRPELKLAYIKANSGLTLTDTANTSTTVNTATSTDGIQVPHIILNQNDEDNMFIIGDMKFFIITEGEKVGVKNKHEDIVVPAEYDEFDIIKPCKHFAYPVFIALKDNTTDIYDFKGNLLAQKLYDTIYVYKDNKTYSYDLDDAEGIVSVDNTAIGTYTLNNKGVYKYKRTKFSLFKPHYVIQLISTLISYDDTKKED